MASDASQDRRLVYKICRRGEWQDALRSGRYAGSADDLRDGFIHLSAAGQVARTAEKYFRNEDGLMLIAFPAARLGTALRWEVSRGGTLFPHHYGAIDVTLAVSVKPMPLGADGVPELPAGIEPC
jgi:uncharacterized protein (DUF952 family)